MSNTILFIAEYIWIDAFGDLRSKCRTLQYSPDFSLSPEFYPRWNFDGSSTGQAISDDSEIVIIPRAIFKNPFEKEYISRLVLCDCYEPRGENGSRRESEDKRIFNLLPIETNTRKPAMDIFRQTKNDRPWFGLEQEYVLYDLKTNRPLGWKEKMEPQGKYYCSVGSDRAFGRHIIDEHYIKCLSAGLKISGINAEVMPSQWEFQIGPCEGIEASDHMWIARYILHKICEKNNIMASLDSKPEDNWNGSGCHINFSSQIMRQDNGIKHILVAIKKLEPLHQEHLAVYGDNKKRLIGTHETSSKDNFTWGVSDRTASVRIPLLVHEEKKGYFEDRRPASKVDPYVATAKLAETILLK